ncbi:Uncharacterised protein [Brucella suis]|nr:Uncharacterised protein [Brucella suis]
MAVFARLHVFGASFNSRFHNLVGIASFRLVDDFANAIEHEGNRAGFAERTARLGEGGTHIGCRSIAIVRQRLDNDRYAAGATALIAHFIIVLAVIAGSLLDGALNIVLGHGLRLGILDRQTQARVHRRVGHPCFAATVISRASLENIFDRTAS